MSQKLRKSLSLQFLDTKFEVVMDYLDSPEIRFNHFINVIINELENLKPLSSITEAPINDISNIYDVITFEIEIPNFQMH